MTNLAMSSYRMKIEDVTGCLLADKHGLCLAGELIY